MTYKVNIDDKVPFFIFTDHDGNEFKNNDLVGGPVVLYFYPKDDTPGCIREACSFRDNIEKINILEALLIGISPDSINSHEKFSAKYCLNYTLLSDEKLILCKAFDVVIKDREIERTTFVIDSKGVIKWIERPVSLEGHVERVIKAVENLV